MTPTVLLLTHSRDEYVVDRVAACLQERGVRPFRFDTDRFLGEVDAEISFPSSSRSGAARDGLVLTDRRSGESVRGAEIAAAWTRSLWPATAVESIDAEYRDGARLQAQCALRGVFAALGPVRWTNDPSANQRAIGDKVLQLRVARQVGLEIPETLVTNDPEAARRFVERVRDAGGAVVTKLLAALSMSMDRSGAFVPTTEVDDEVFEQLDSLRLAPMIFQVKAEKASELRIQMVDGEIFAGAIDASGTSGATDWRLVPGGSSPWRRAEVPSAVADRLRRLMRALDLEYGAIDVIRTPEEEYLFLEVNPLGEWGMLERDLDLPISRAVADHLAAIT